jgi:hypothetical protein
VSRPLVTSPEVVAFGRGQPAGAGSLGTPLDAHHVFDCLSDGVRVTDHGDQLVAARLGLQLTGARAGVLLSSAEQIHAED